MNGRPDGMAAETTADKAATAGMTPAEYRAASHRAAVEEVRAAVRGMYAETAFRILDVLDGLATVEEAHPPATECIAEVLEDDAAWMYLGTSPDRGTAARRRASVIRRHPDAKTRTVLKTTTYTVLPDPDAAPSAADGPRLINPLGGNAS